MEKIFFFIILGTFLIGCNKPIKSIKLHILMDQPLKYKKLIDIDDLSKIVEPFYYHDTLIAPIVNFVRIDILPTLKDSIRNDGLIKLLNEWMSGNSKNAQKLEKQLKIANKKFQFNQSFLVAVDSPDTQYKLNNKINAIVYSPKRGLYKWGKNSVNFFSDTLNLIKDHIGEVALQSIDNNEIIYLWYNPLKEYIIETAKIDTTKLNKKPKDIFTSDIKPEIKKEIQSFKETKEGSKKTTEGVGLQNGGEPLKQ